MIGFDESERCYGCDHEASCHTSTWTDRGTLYFSCCEVEGCGCAEFEHSHWEESTLLEASKIKDALPPKVGESEPPATFHRALFSIRWEHRVYVCQPTQSHMMGTVLNEMSRDGWELVHIEQSTHPDDAINQLIYYFKRPRLKGVISVEGNLPQGRAPLWPKEGAPQ